MRNFQSSPHLEAPDLVEIKVAAVGNKRVSEFTMNVRLKQVRTEDSAKGAPKGAAKKG